MFTTKPLRYPQGDYYGCKDPDSIISQVDRVVVQHTHTLIAFIINKKDRFHVRNREGCYAYDQNGRERKLSAPVKYIPRDDDYFLQDAQLLNMYKELVEAEKK